jgi:hypothetical protein
MEAQSDTHTTTRSIECHLNPKYVMTPNGILKIIEFVLAIIAFACAVHMTNNYRESQSFGWVSFVAFVGFMMAVFYLLVHILITTSWTWTIIVEMISYAIWTILFLIAGIVAAATARGNATAGAACAFSFFSMAAWAIDTGLMFMHNRISFTSSSTTTTTTTTSNTAPNNNAKRFEENPQY